MKSAIKKYIPFTVGRKLRGLWQKTQSVYYKGNNLYCPFCGNSFRKMLPGGSNLPVIAEKEIIAAGRRNNCVCPRCYSTDRDRLIYLYIKYKTNFLKKHIKLLHVSPSGAVRAWLSSQPNIDYNTGTKHHEGFYYSKNIPYIDITKIDCEDQTFDLILCNHVLEHIKEDKKAISELYRIIKPEGQAILQVPISKKLKNTYEDPDITSPSDREKYFGQFDHVRIYGQDYTSRLEIAGFKVNILNPLKNNWNVENLDKFAINYNEDLYIALK